MGRFGDPAITKKFTSVFARWKARRRSGHLSATAAVEVEIVADLNDMASYATESGDMEPQSFDSLAMEMQHMDLSRLPSLPITPSSTFEFEPPATSPKWPGPRYDDLVQFVPGIFDRSRDLQPKTKARTKQKRATAKRRSSDEKRPATSRGQRRLDAPSAIIKAQTDSRAPPKRPQYYQVSTHRAEPLHLLSLPGEIRNSIYSLLFVSKAPLKAQFRSVLKPHTGGKGSKLKRFPREPVLALVSKQLRREATSYFYAENTFVFATALPRAPPRSLHRDPCTPLLLRLPMTSADCLARWQVASTTAALTRLELHFGADPGPGEPYVPDACRYVLRRLAANGALDVQLAGTDEQRCDCAERELADEVLRPALARGEPGSGGATTLLDGAILFVARRAAEWRSKESRQLGKWFIEHGRWGVRCTRCGREGWRRVDNGNES